jgi:hypothetical protein
LVDLQHAEHGRSVGPVVHRLTVRADQVDWAGAADGAGRGHRERLADQRVARADLAEVQRCRRQRADQPVTQERVVRRTVYVAHCAVQYPVLQCESTVATSMPSCDVPDIMPSTEKELTWIAYRTE